MSLSDLSPSGNHLWQSTLCAVAAWLLTLTLRKNRAAVRYWIWLAASAKFLIPFSLLVSAGSQLGWRTLPAIKQPQFSMVVEQIGQPFALQTLRAVGAPASSEFPAVLLGLWFCGLAIGVVSWVRWWRRIRALQRSATPLYLDNLPIQAVSCSACLEPGVFGIRKPVLLLPAGIADRLPPAQLEAIVAHELCHVRRRDNLTAAIHMVVEAIFWFHPLLWWIRTRLVEERERACDEEVLKGVSDPRIYAEGILNVCKFYLRAPAICVSGVTGSDLKKRIEKIMAHRVARKLNPGRKFVLAVAGILVVGGPIVVGLVNAPPSQAQSRSQDAAAPAFEVASVKPNKSGTRGGNLNTEPGRLTITNLTLRTCIKAAYHLQDYQLTGGPGWPEAEHYDIVAKAENPAGDDQLMLMLQRLLAERFQLAFHRATKEMPGYALTVGKNGTKLHEVELAGNGWMRNHVDGLSGQEVSMARLAEVLSGRLGRPVLDQTGIKGVFDLKLAWTPDQSLARNPGEGKESAAVESASDASGVSIFTALQEQLGLKLEARKVPGEILVIDHIERPSEN